MPLPVRCRNPLRLIGVYTIARKPTILSKISMSIYLLVRTHQIMHTKVRRRGLLRTIRAYTIRGKSSIFTNLSPCWDVAYNAYPDQTPQLAAPNRGLHHLRETYNSQQNSDPILSSCWDAAKNVYPDQTPNLLRLISEPTPSAMKATIFRK